jgi:photosystem II stability/assembly factor-like uncharacterized protein
LYGVSFTNASNGTAVGQDGIILRTTDGGQSWIDQPSGTTITLYGVCFIDVNNGLVVGSGGTIIGTTDGGQNWMSQSIGTNTNLYAVSYNSSIWTIVGSEGTIIRNGIIQISGTTNDLFGVCFMDANNGLVVGSGGTILGTTDGGLNWTSQSIGTNTNLYAVSYNSGNWVVVGSEGTIIRNGVFQTSGTLNDLFGVSFTDANNGWAVGGNGTILRTTNGGVTFIEEEQIDEIPTEFLLSQNYPNPFNPSTRLKYSIPNSSQVVIKVYDILGNEIETLVNEEKPAGTYEITWSAESLPSGVYFYQLKASDPSTSSGQGFVQTKKMLLLK